jgi:hypothetical protein
MDLNHVAGELAGPRHDDLTREQFAGRILAAFQEVQVETERRLWRECGLPEYFLGNGGTNHKLVAFAERCGAAVAPTSQPDQVVVALAGLFATLWTHSAGRSVLEQMREAGLICKKEDGSHTLTELGALALADGGR